MFVLITYPALLFIWIFMELKGRRLGWGGLFQVLKDRSDANKRSRLALVFAMIVTLVFTYWERFLIYLFDQPRSQLFVVAGCAAFVLLIYRRRKPRPLDRGDILCLLAFVGLYLSSFLAILFCPWVLLRAFILPVKA